MAPAAVKNRHMPTRKPSAEIGAIGVTRTKLYVQETLGWIFRDQLDEDYGIDAHVEVVDGRDVRGRLLALQIKSGGSWFREKATDGWWYRPDPDHVRYWTNHALPVVVVLYNPATAVCHWQLVSEATLQRTTSDGWKIRVPEANVLDETAIPAWRTAADGSPYELRLRELRLARPWMEMLAQGTRLVLDFEEWINKSSGRGMVSVGVDREDGSGIQELVSWQFLFGPVNYGEAVPQLFAWADLDVHAETYDDAEYDQNLEERSVWDESDQVFAEPFSEGRPSREMARIRPYRNGAGEVDFYRLEMTLNELGRAFLVVDEFATNGRRQLTP
ncbi:DUF4365 domain-containing protein [Micromonospora sp. C51]|uniref:DUF4365 domain-containing protein n=1 Tax=Micromonospora sp. C51 TaxID=2824879 RepID=UPI001B368F46|nr:DUF4365 domain-containing protein [Micromonospora sp. C51]MBQ1049225.1 DUF4365 domain-containing protein [Micromonospora sp. C51]